MGRDLEAGAAVRRVYLEESPATGWLAGKAAVEQRASGIRWQRNSCGPRCASLLLLLATGLVGGAMGAGPTLQAVEDVVIKACADPLVRTVQACPAASSCQDGEANLVLGHSDPTLIGSMVVSIQRVVPAISNPLSTVRDVVVRSVSGQKVITVCPKGKESGRSTVYIRITDTNGVSILSDFGIVVQPLSPVFDDAGPTRYVSFAHSL